MPYTVNDLRENSAVVKIGEEVEKILNESKRVSRSLPEA